MIIRTIQAVYEIYGDAADKKRKLPFGSAVSNRILAILVLCKNFRFLRFNFKFAGVEAGRNITNSLLHHARCFKYYNIIYKLNFEFNYKML